jgi:hypothetical protein
MSLIDPNHYFFEAMFTSKSFESRLASVKNALEAPTRKPPVPKDRLPKIHPKIPKKLNQFTDFGLEYKKDYGKKELAALQLWKSTIMMVGSFIERAPESQRWARSELQEFLTQIEICLELKTGKLDLQQYGNLLLKLDAIAPFKDGELAEDLKSLDEIVSAYGDKLAAQ